ncbi:MAG: amino acid adenylation domain-containing protein [Lachnospiraceae bacterium]|nr:amino acid adenylation domain-containing protein [Lachnospiraceae bacterium]
MLERSAARFPDKKAFGDPGKSITFGELYDKVKRIAALLAKGEVTAAVGPESGVGFYMEKSVDAVCAMFGTILAGGFYSFIDVRQPAERAASVISVLRPCLIITDEEDRENLTAALKEGGFGKAGALEDGAFDGSAAESGAAESGDAADKAKPEVILISELMRLAEACDGGGGAAVSDGAVGAAGAAGASGEGCYDLMPLYVNFTSGSTGTPKGVAVGHASVIDFITEFTRVFGINDNDVIANQAPFDFDVSVKDIYSGLYTGATVQLIPREYFSNPSVLMDYLADNGVTTLIWAVSAMCFVSIMNGLEYRLPEKIDKVMFSGEVMPVKHLNKWKTFLPDATYVNLYGPTEITCNCTYHILDREYGKDEAIPAGIPFANEKVFLLDEDDRLVSKAGEEGEICVGGSCLALGYYRDAEKTAQSFVQNPLNDRFYERIYRTGDIGKYDEDGNLVYVSRKDFQIKHMGQRIELGEIEVSAMALDGVTRACCLYDQKKKKILLYYTGSIDKKDVTENLQRRLPQYMVPGRTVQVESMPMNKNGKIDRKALAEL